MALYEEWLPPASKKIYFAIVLAQLTVSFHLLNNQNLSYRQKKNIYSYLSTFACRELSHTLAKLL